MSILVDTSVWSLAFRRKKQEGSPIASALADLIAHDQAKIIGPIRQELLSSISDPHFFELLKNKLRAFTDVPVVTEHYELAADLSNRCRRRGIQGSHVDFLICSVSSIDDLPIFTTDCDFVSYSKIVKLNLYQIKS